MFHQAGLSSTSSTVDDRQEHRGLYVQALRYQNHLRLGEGSELSEQDRQGLQGCLSHHLHCHQHHILVSRSRHYTLYTIQGHYT